MADIEIIYQSYGKCDYDMKDYCRQCYTCCAGDLGCEAYIAEGAGEIDNETGLMIIPFGNCSRASFKYRHKGWSGKRYEIGEPQEDPYNPHLDYVEVTLGNTTYDAVKVRLNGKLIYNNYDDEEVNGQ